MILRGQHARRRAAIRVGLLSACVYLGSASCRPPISEDSPLGARVALIGAGASFPALLYQSWAISLYREMPELRINYQSMGSGAGVKQVINGVVDFGASDVAMTPEEVAQVKDGALLLPMTAGAVVLAYNLPGVSAPLRMSRQTYGDIFLGKTTHWRDPAIAADNPEAALPDLPIIVVHRADGSGTTAVLTAHLAAINPEWNDAVGVGKSVEWPRTGTFIGSKGNEGATTQIIQVPGAIGYLDYSYAANNDLAMATLENLAGRFVAPTPETTAASLGSAELPPDFRLFITDPDGPDSYPIVTYTWLLVYGRYDDPLTAKAMEVFIEYGLTRGQDVAPALGYAPLPQAVREQVAAAADVISPDYAMTLQPGGRR